MNGFLNRRMRLVVSVLALFVVHVVISVFTANHYGVGAYIEDAIGRIGEQVADYYATH